ncbi:PF20097 family protein [Clostridium ganghwense]|uniref:PF20097 family protein n=1 Tax=Clostridium ganghwense TaxID=312089 RepID=A0ABT4CUT7_9CLOT|nr:PF20097 family protein [Clostridium ganghwense]MCY6372208.1 PF20097 family protein [Clostridium ganghwense]
MKLECPYCKGDLIKGFIDSGLHSLKWHNENMGLLEKVTVFGGEVLSDCIRVKCYRRKNCNKIIIDLNEL